MGRWYYVCDRCGDFLSSSVRFVPDGEGDTEWKCATEDCDSDSAWEFTDRRNAESHSQRIQRGLSSGLFRKSLRSQRCLTPRPIS